MGQSSELLQFFVELKDNSLLDVFGVIFLLFWMH